MSWLRDVLLVAQMALVELRHRRSVLVVAVLTVAFLALYAYGASQILPELRDVSGGAGLAPEETRRGAGFILLGVAVFATFALGAVLAIFTTMTTVKGEAELGLLQPLLVRPVARSAVIVGRVLAATAAGLLYSAIAVAGASIITAVAGGSPPGNIPLVLLALALAFAILASFAAVISTFLGTAATGQAATMLLLLGFFVSLVAQIADATGAETLAARSDVIAHVFGHTVLYEAALGSLTAGVSGLAGLVIQLGPFGSQRELDLGLVALALLEIAILCGAATWRLRRLDL